MRNDSKKQIFNNSIMFLSFVTIMTAKTPANRKKIYT